MRQDRSLRARSPHETGHLHYTQIVDDYTSNRCFSYWCPCRGLYRHHRTTDKGYCTIRTPEHSGGEPLPANFSSRYGETATVFWATLNLYVAGNATFAERRRRESATFQQENTNSRLTDYEINGETIAIGPPCPHDPLADRYPKRYGQIRDSTLTLSGEIGEPHTLVYEYRLAVSN